MQLQFPKKKMKAMNHSKMLETFNQLVEVRSCIIELM